MDLIDALLEIGIYIQRPGSSINRDPPIDSAVGYGQPLAVRSSRAQPLMPSSDGPAIPCTAEMSGAPLLADGGMGRRIASRSRRVASGTSSYGPMLPVCLPRRLNRTRRCA